MEICRLHVPGKGLPTHPKPVSFFRYSVPHSVHIWLSKKHLLVGVRDTKSIIFVLSLEQDSGPAYVPVTPTQNLSTCCENSRRDYQNIKTATRKWVQKCFHRSFSKTQVFHRHKHSLDFPHEHLQEKNCVPN